ncbi:MAG: hypothetical protein ABJL67_03210 [Sulfitobacter sp.]
MTHAKPHTPDPSKMRGRPPKKSRWFAKLLTLALIGTVFVVMRTEPEERMAFIYGNANKAFIIAGREPIFDVPVAGDHAKRVAEYTKAYKPDDRPRAGLTSAVKVNRFRHETGNAAGISNMLTGGASGEKASSKGRGDWIGDTKSQAADIGSAMENFKVGQ